jgi:myo-inositol 2-dehydrogenase/D-chiro-inositol 1-dehydrogenase
MTDFRNPPAKQPRDESRRGFIRGSSLLLAGALPSASINTAAPQAACPLATPSKRELKVGLIGCGYQGIATVNDMLNATNQAALDSANAPSSKSGLSISLQLTALADAFPDRLQQALRTLRGRHGEQVQVDSRSRFLGLNAYQDLLATDVDLVLLAAPTVFRPLHFEQAIAAGKHVYAESPIAVDGSGVERFQLANSHAIALQRVVGIGLTHRQHPHYQQTIERLQQGAIGKLLSLRLYRGTRTPKRTAVANAHSEFDTQLRNWPDYPWASGGSELEQWALRLDVANWLLQSHPLAACSAPRDRIVGSTVPLSLRSGSAPTPGEFATEFAVEFTYPGGVKLQCQSESNPRQLSKHGRLVVHGTQGWSDLAAGAIFDANGALIWRANDRLGDCDTSNRWLPVLSAIAEGEKWNQGSEAIECTLSAILGRLAVNSQKQVTWDECLQSREVFDCITTSTADLGVDRNATIERYLASWNK